MSVTVRIPTILRPYTDNKSTVELSASGSLSEVLTALEVAAPGIGARVLDDGGALRRFVNVYVGEDDVRFLDGLNTQVADGATVSIVPAVAGGSVQHV